MENSSKNSKFMLEATKLAKKGSFSTSPNPNVGCVIVHKDKIISKGYHIKSGCEHAEINALKNFKPKIHRNSKLYVTLEPCSFTGKTGPCVNEIVKSGIKEVIIGTKDPNPKVNGKGISFLKKHGIKVKTGVLKKTCEDLNKGFNKRMIFNLPYVTLKSALSTNNMISSKKSKWISNAKSRKDVQFLRALSCGILTSSDTIINDNPKLNVRLKRKELHINTKVRQPIVFILDTNLKIKKNKYKLFKDSRKKVIFNRKKNANDEKNNIVYRKVKSSKNGMNLKEVLKIMAKEFYINNLLVEAGQKVFTEFLSKNLYDEIIIYKSSTVESKGGIKYINENLLKNNKKINFFLNGVNFFDKDIKISFKKK